MTRGSNTANTTVGLAGGPEGPLAAVIARAYDDGAASWAAGPAFVYDQLAAAVCEHLPDPIAGAVVLDCCAGTGAVSRALVRRGARVVAFDLARAMLEVDRSTRPPAVHGDALAIPLRTHGVDAVVTAFGLSHADDPLTMVRELRRVTRRRGVVLAAVFADAPGHPVKEIVDRELRSLGYVEPLWHHHVKQHTERSMGTVASMTELMRAAGLRTPKAMVERIVVDVDPVGIVHWRLGMASHAQFVATLDTDGRARLVDRCVELVALVAEPLRPAVLVAWARC